MPEKLLREIKNAQVDSGELYYWWLGQMGWCIRTVSKTLYIDPYLSPREKRNFLPALIPESIDNADIILCTHDHLDHIDHPALAKIMVASPSALLVVPDVAVSDLIHKDGIDPQRIVSMNDGIEKVIAECKVSAVKAKHEAFDYTEEFGYPYLQYIIEVDGKTIYHSGDTLLYEGMQSKLAEWNIDIAFVPINGRDSMRYRRNCMGCMTWQEAVDLVGELNPRLVCPGHWDMFSDNSENPLLFTDYCRVKYPELTCWIGSSGQGGKLA